LITFTSNSRISFSYTPRNTLSKILSPTPR
jgi:hypothetical protein